MTNLLGFDPGDPDCPDCGGAAPAVTCDVLLATSGWCDQTGAPVDVLYVRDCATSALTISFVSPTTGSVVVPALPLIACAGGDDFEQLAICDVDPATGAVLGVYLVRTVYDPNTGTVTTTLVNVATGLPYVPTGVPRFCSEGIDTEQQIICVEDTVGNPGVGFQVLLHTQYLGGAIIANYLTPLDNTFVPIPGWGVSVVASDLCLGTTRHVEELCYREPCTETVSVVGAGGPTLVIQNGTPAGGSLVTVTLDFNGDFVLAAAFHNAVTGGTCDGVSLSSGGVPSITFPTSVIFGINVVGDTVEFSFDRDAACPFIGDCCTTWNTWFNFSEQRVIQSLALGGTPIPWPGIDTIDCHDLFAGSRQVEGVKTIESDGTVTVVLYEADGSLVTRQLGDSVTVGACPPDPTVTHPALCGGPTADTGPHDEVFPPVSVSALPAPVGPVVNFHLPPVAPGSAFEFAGPGALDAVELAGGWVAGPAASQPALGVSTYEYGLLGLETHVIPACATNVTVALVAQVLVDFIDNPAVPAGGANITIAARFVDVTNLALPSPAALGFLNLAGPVGSSAAGVLTIPLSALPPTVNVGNLGVLIAAEISDAGGEFARVTTTGLTIQFTWETDLCVDAAETTLVTQCVQENVEPICWTDGISGDQSGLLIVRTWSDGTVTTEPVDAGGRTLPATVSWTLGACASGGAQTTEPADSWGQTLVTAATSPWSSPANLTSLAVVALTTGTTVSVNGAPAIPYRAGQSGEWGQDGANVPTKAAAYVVVTVLPGSEAFVTWQTRP